MSHNIPIEIQFEIIKKVSDIKSFVRFRSISKPWKSFIDSPKFITGYRARKSQPRTLLLRYKDHTNVVRYLSVNNHTFKVHQDLAPNVSAFMKKFNDLSVIGFSRGLLCLYNREMFVMCNFSIRRSVGVHAPEGFRVFGFAVCPVIKDPTIVSISLDWKVQIFTLSSKKWTTEIQCIMPRETITLDEGSQAIIGSCIYRVAHEEIRLQNGRFANQYMIVAFDLIVKEFIVIDLPYQITRMFTSRARFIISKIKGSLVVSVPYGDVFEVWKPGCSFTKLFTIDPVTKKVVFNNFRTPRVSHLNNLGFGGQDGSFYISSYKETLHLLDHSDSCVYPEIN